MNIRKGLFCSLTLLFIVCVAVGCKTTPPSLGYIPPSKEIVEAYVNENRKASIDSVPFDGAYLDFGKDGGHTTQRVVWVTAQNGKVLNQPFVNHGVDITGRLSSNSGAFIGAGTVIASPLWGYLGRKAQRDGRSYFSGGNAIGTGIASAGVGP